MIIFSHTLTPRLQYVVNFLADYFQTSIRIICDEDNYLADKDPHKINYSYHRLTPAEVWIHSHVLLFETAVRQVKVECFEHQPVNKEQGPYKAFFKAEGDFDFDIFAGIFYLLSRYEEYLPHKKDNFGRYAAENSVAHREGFIHVPLINIWLRDFSTFLENKFHKLKLRLPAYSFLPTYDIDMAWSFKNKGIARNAGAFVKLFFTGKWGSIARRIRVLQGKRQDPYDVYDWLEQLHATHALKPVYFFLVAQQTGRFDKNISTENPEFRQLLLHIAGGNTVGLHPSWASGDQPQLLTREKNCLESITETPIHHSRQHFIRFDLPASYRRLVALGVTHDYSMGYGSINGFRASVATPFFWYDLKNETVTPLRVEPFCFMDATAYYEHGHTPEAAYEEMKHYLAQTKQYNGKLITIWHNSFLGTERRFQGWREVYERFVQEAVTT